jgi:FkbM family methyltransferase
MNTSKGIEIFKKLLKMFLCQITNHLTYKMHYGLSKGLKRKGGFGFIPKIMEISKEEMFYTNYNFKNKVVYDIGANNGLVTLYFARAVESNGKVLSFEPNPYLFKILQNNIKANLFQNVLSYNLAIGCEDKKDYLIYDPYNAATGSLNEKIKSSIANQIFSKKIQINITSLDKLISTENIPGPEFVKIDVEGYEYEVLCGMQKTIETRRPELFIEIHGSTDEDKYQNIKLITEYLIKNAYSVEHIETGNIINESNFSAAMRGHIYCRC